MNTSPHHLHRVSQAVILAGGRGERLRPLTNTLPKPLVPVAGQPFLRWQMKELASLGVRRVVVLVSYLGEQIERELERADYHGLDICCVHEAQPLGTGGALGAARSHLDPHFLLLNGDSFLRISLARMEEYKVSQRCSAVMATSTRLGDHPVPANVKAHQGRVTSYQKGAGSENGFERIDAGVYLLDRAILPPVSSEKFDLETLWPDLIKSQGLGAFDTESPFYDIGTQDRLAKFASAVPALFPEAAAQLQTTS